MSAELERDVRFLKRYSIGMTAVVLVLGVGAFVRPPHAEKFTEIDVERINVREPDGKYRLVISNRPRSIGPIYKMQPFGNGVPMNAQRAFFGKDRAKNAAVVLSDPAGKPRLRMVVDSLGGARIEFLDTAGKVIRSVGPTT